MRLKNGAESFFPISSPLQSPSSSRAACDVYWQDVLRTHLCFNLSSAQLLSFIRF